MKKLYLTLAASAAFLSVATPAAAQSWQMPNRSGALQMQLDDNVRSGAISRNEAMPLRDSLRELMTLETQFSRGGISGRENNILLQRSNALRQRIDVAARSGGYESAGGSRATLRADWESRYDRDHRAAWDARYARERAAEWDGRFERKDADSNGRYERKDGTSASMAFDRPNRGDRFAGDVRVGQRPSDRMTPVPAEYRIQYADNDQVYYGYDRDRIYRVDRMSGVVLGMLDLPN